MGVRSTGPFLEFVIDECKRQLGAYHAIDYPPMVIFSWPTPYYFDREFDEAELEETIGAGLEWLASTGVDFIAMPCNSAHVYYDRLVSRVNVPLVDMIEVTAASIRPESGTVALLGTRSTRDSGLYQKALRAKGLEVLDREDTQVRLDQVLTSVQQASDLSEPRSHFRTLLSDLKEEGVQTALLACTDLNYLVEGDPALPLIDAGRALAVEVVSRWGAAAGITAVADDSTS
jgi:aspartate racemase